MSSELENQAAFEATLVGFFFRQFTRPRTLPARLSLVNKLAVVTGSNTGLGLEACRQLLKLGLSRLIMGVRSQMKGDEAATQLRKEFPTSTVTVWIVDMQSYNSIRAFVAQCASLPRIDITILNAALIKTSYTSVISTGHEISLQVNYLSTAFLALLLLPLIRSKKILGDRPPILSVVGSDLTYRVDIEPMAPALQQFDKPEDNVLINMQNPGTTKGTSFFREFPTLAGKLVGVLQFFFARSVSVGATTYLDAVISRGKESHGSFISDWAIKPYPLLWYTPEGQEFNKRLWEETIQELNFAGVSKIIEGIKPRSL